MVAACQAAARCPTVRWLLDSNTTDPAQLQVPAEAQSAVSVGLHRQHPSPAPGPSATTIPQLLATLPSCAAPCPTFSQAASTEVLPGCWRPAATMAAIMCCSLAAAAAGCCRWLLRARQLPPAATSCRPVGACRCSARHSTARPAAGSSPALLVTHQPHPPLSSAPTSWPGAGCRR